ncbi:MAG: hypothetical protein ACYCZU_02120 [Devosia sp.]
MRNIAIFAAILLLPLALAACGDNTNAADEEAKVKEAVAFLSTADGTPGIFVKGRDVVLNYASRPPTFADSARKAALDASKATGGKAIKVYVVDSPDVATAVPAAGQFYCSISADDGRMAGNNC